MRDVSTGSHHDDGLAGLCIVAAGQLRLRVHRAGGQHHHDELLEPTALIVQAVPPRGLAETAGEYSLQPGYGDPAEFQYGLDVILDALSVSRQDGWAERTVWYGRSP